MIFAGLIGSGILGVITSGGTNASAVSQLKPNIAIMVQFIRLFLHLQEFLI
jgi:hypothetical protein